MLLVLFERTIVNLSGAEAPCALVHSCIFVLTIAISANGTLPRLIHSFVRAFRDDAGRGRELMRPRPSSYGVTRKGRKGDFFPLPNGGRGCNALSTTEEYISVQCKLSFQRPLCFYLRRSRQVYKSSVSSFFLLLSFCSKSSYCTMLCASTNNLARV